MTTPAFFQVFNDNFKFPISSDKVIANAFRTSLGAAPGFGPEVYAELYAFTLHENSNYGIDKWHTYFGPAALLFESGVAGEEIQFNKITPEVVDYWERRATESTHPVLISRYAGLVWEFSNKVRGKKAPFQMAITYLDNLLTAASTEYYSYVTLLFVKLTRVLDLSIRLNLQDLKNKAINAIRNLELAVGALNAPGYWKYSYELLVRNKSVKIDEQLSQQIIQELELRLAAGIALENGRPKDLNAATVAADYLAEYYRKEKQSADIARVLELLNIGFNSTESFSNVAMQIHQLEMMYKRYIDNGMQQEAEETIYKIRSLGPQLMAEMKVIQSPIEISMDLIDRFIEMIFQGDERAVFFNLAVGFLQTADELKPDNKSIYDMLSKSLYDHTGRKVSVVGPITTDDKGNAIITMGNSMTLISVYLQYILKAGKDKGVIERGALMRLISSCEWFEPVKHPIFYRAFHAYEQNDAIVFLHLAVPQVEAACLKIFEQNGGQIWKEGKSGGFHVRLLDDILRDKAFIALIGDNIALYFRAVFTDQRGWNLRNNIAHGLASAETMTAEKADRVLLILLLIPFLAINNKLDY